MCFLAVYANVVLPRLKCLTSTRPLADMAIVRSNVSWIVPLLSAFAAYQVVTAVPFTRIAEVAVIKTVLLAIDRTDRAFL